MSLDPYVVALAKLPGLDGASRSQLESLARGMTYEQFNGRTFINEGEASDALYFLLDGQVEVIRSTGTGDRVVVGLISGPAILGFAGALAHRERLASVRARGHIDLLRLSHDRAHALLNRDDDVSAVLRRALMVHLANQLARADRLFGRLASSAGGSELASTLVI